MKAPSRPPEQWETSSGSRLTLKLLHSTPELFHMTSAILTRYFYDGRAICRPRHVLNTILHFIWALCPVHCTKRNCSELHLFCLYLNEKVIKIANELSILDFRLDYTDAWLVVFYLFFSFTPVSTSFRVEFLPNECNIVWHSHYKWLTFFKLVFFCTTVTISKLKIAS